MQCEISAELRITGSAQDIYQLREMLAFVRDEMQRRGMPLVGVAGRDGLIASDIEVREIRDENGVELA